MDYAPAFRKKMSVPQRQGNVTTLHGGRLNAETGIRFKRVGNLMTLEPTYTGGAPRMNSLNKSGNSNLFLRNIFNE